MWVWVVEAVLEGVVVAVAVEVGKAIEVEVAGVRAVLNENDVGAIAGLGTTTTF